jgi:hypothetical protein
MKAISLTQPWATAMALGIKSWETRSQKMHASYRGPLLIHASSLFPSWARDFALEQHGATKGKIPLPQDMPLGCIVAFGSLMDGWFRTEDVRGKLSILDLGWGDFSNDRFTFQFQLKEAINPVIKAKGALGLWTPKPDLVEEVYAQMVRQS